MNSSIGNAFQSLDSAHDFVTLLAETVIEAKRDVEGDVPERIQRQILSTIGCSPYGPLQPGEA
jgi:hypothetical protein